MTPMVPARRTMLTADEALQFLVEAHEKVIGGEPNGALLEILCAQSALETAQWRAMWCWNWGNIRGQWHGMWTSFRAGEIEDGQEVILEPGPGNVFRAYPDAETGAEDFVAFLGVASHPPEPNRFAAAWEAACHGDVAGYVEGLKAGGYFTANEGAYLKAIRSEEHYLEHFPTMLAYLIEPGRTPTEPAPPPDGLEGHPV